MGLIIFMHYKVDFLSILASRKLGSDFQITEKRKLPDEQQFDPYFPGSFFNYINIWLSYNDMLACDFVTDIEQ